MLVPIACGVGVVVVLSPLLVPMVALAAGGGSVYEPGSDRYVADVLGYAAFSPFHLLSSLGAPVNRRTGDQIVYLGLVNIAVLAWACVRAKHESDEWVPYVLSGMAVFCISASGDFLHVAGHRTIPLPGIILSHLPFFKNVRTPVRAIVFVYLFMAIGIGHAFQLAWRQRPRLWVRGSVVTLVGLLMVVDFYPFGLATTSIACDPGLSVVREDPESGFGVLDLPGGYFEGNFYMFNQAACHGRPIVQGNTSRDVAVTLRDRLEVRDFQKQRGELTEAKVKYIVITHPAQPVGARFSWLKGLFRDWHPDDGREDEYRRTYPVAYDSPDLTVLRVY